MANVCPFDVPQTPVTDAAVCVIDWKAPCTPPTVSVVMEAVELPAELVCLTHTVWLFEMVAGLAVKGAVQPMEYEPPETEIGAAALIPVIVMVFEVIVELTATPVCAMNENASGVVSATCDIQLASVPPLTPLHVQDHGPLPRTAVAIPAVHRFAIGALDTILPFAAPQAPFRGDVPGA